MTDFVLTIGNKELSSWSLRPWYLMTHAQIPFEEQNIALDRPASRKELAAKSPSKLVPFLTHGDLTVWDSLAIAEYMNDLFPEKNLWPQDVKTRALARAVSAQMHSGFSALRTVWPMMVTRRDLAHTTSGGVLRDIEDIDQIWTRYRKIYSDDGPFLFGQFSIADAMFAPVASRFATYGPVNVSEQSAAYMQTLLNQDAMHQWEAGARAELGAS